MRIKSKFICISIIYLLVSIETWAYTYADSSKLAKGDWYKIRISESGIYKLTYSDLVNMGVKNPSKAKIYGYGGYALNPLFSETFLDDLPQVSIWQEKGDDGVFGSGDYILFYGRGPLNWTYNETKKEYIQERNPYSTYGYYFISDNEEEEVSLIPMHQNSTFAPKQTITTFDYYTLHEKELYNYLASGIEFYGELFTSTPQNFTFNIPGITQEEGLISVDMVSRVDPSYPAYYTVKIGNKEYINSKFATINGSDGYNKVRSAAASAVWDGEKEQNTTLNVTYKKTGNEYARLNYIRLNCSANLGLYGSYTFFRNKKAKGVTTQYLFKNTVPSSVIWNVTSATAPEQMETVISGNDLSFTTTQRVATEFVILNPSATFNKPEILGKVASQNLHGLKDAQLVIISQPDLVSQAEVLANIHRVRDSLSVAVVLPEQIYNEFSSGTPDATAYRWFLKMLQDRKRGGNYLLLFGDGTYDNRLLTAESREKTPFSFILTYQSRNSTTAFDSYVTDDYFGFLEDGEGVNIGDNNVDVGIGRIPATNITEARRFVAKILTYMNNTTIGTWKNNICFWADDEDNNLHMRQANQLAQKIETSYPEFSINKVFLDAYKQKTTSIGSTYPDAKNKLMNLIELGQLIVNYTGHGNTICLTGEDMLNETDIENFHTDKLALWITATCDFTRFDDIEQSAGEKLLLTNKSGAIASFSTTRIVSASPNFLLNQALLDNLFTKKDGKRLRLGDIMKKTKCSLGAGENKLNFALFGDPALYLAYPEYQAKITEFKNKAISKFSTDTISALETIEIAGHILAPNGTIDTSFNGNLISTVFDKEDNITTLNNDGTATTTFSFNDRSNVLYSGNTEVSNGLFNYKFTVPKDNSYSYQVGKINLYAADNRSKNEAQGYYNQFIIGGTNATAAIDTTGPSIAIYLNSTNFKEGDKVNEAPVFFAYVDDSSGINKSSNNIGHNIILVIDENTTNPIILNSYLENAGEGNKGLIRYKLDELEEGEHTLYFRIWDIHNNSSSQLIHFEVVKGLEPEIFETYTIYDKASDVTTFYIEHNRPGVELNINIELFNHDGARVWHYEETTYSNETIYTLPWARTSDQGNKLQDGVYIYKVTIRSNNSEDGIKTKKLMITKQ